MPGVLLIAPDDRFAHARLASVLHRARCRVTLLGNPWGVVARSRFVAERIACPDTTAGISQAVRTLLAYRGNRYQWVIVADETALAALATCRGQAWLDGWFPIDHRSSLLDVCIYKTAFVVAAERAGIPIPASRVCDAGEDAADAADEMGFPVVLKARVSAGGRMVRRADDRESLLAAFSQLSQGEEVVVQQLIDGQVGGTEILMNHGQLVCWTHYHSLYCWEGPFGPATVRRYLLDTRLDEIARMVGALTGFHGLCGIDWIHGQCADAFHVLEFNARPTMGYHLARHINVNFGSALRSVMSGRPVLQRPVLPRGATAAVYMFPHHVERCLATGDYAGLLHWLPGAARHEVPWDDPALLLQHVPNAVSNTLTIARGLATLAVKRWWSRSAGLLAPAPAWSATPVRTEGNRP